MVSNTPRSFCHDIFEDECDSKWEYNISRVENITIQGSCHKQSEIWLTAACDSKQLSLFKQRRQSKDENFYNNFWPQSDHLRKLSYGWYPPPSAFLSCGNLSTFWGTFNLRVFHYLRDANVESWEGVFFLHLDLHSNTVDWTRGAGFAFRFSFRKQSQRGNLEKLEKLLSLDFQD